MLRIQHIAQRFALALGLLAAGLHASPLPQEKVQVLDPEDEAFFDQLAGSLFAPDGPGGVVLLAREGELLYHKPFGLANLENQAPVTLDSKFGIASVTKPIIAAAILRLAEGGELALDDRLPEYFPEYAQAAPQVTIEHLLSHSSGLHNYNNFDEDRPRGFFTQEHSPEELLAHFVGLGADFDPGERYDYSNTGYYLLGRILEQLSGKDLESHLADSLFVPLGMTGTSIREPRRVVPGRTAPYTTTGRHFLNAAPQSRTFDRFADGGIESTAMDLFRWCEALATGQIIGKDSLSAACEPFELRDGSANRVGHGWFVGSLGERRFVAHDGLMAGYSSSLILFPEERVVGVLLSNCNWYRSASPFLLPGIPMRMAARVLGSGYESEAATSSPRELGIYVGPEGQRLQVSQSSGTLQARLGSGRTAPMRRMGSTSFFVERGYRTLEFPAGSGPADSVMVRGGRSARYKRIEEALPPASLAQSLLEVITTLGTDAGRRHLLRSRDDEAFYLRENELRRLAHALFQEGQPEASMEVMAWAEECFPGGTVSAAHQAFVATVQDGLEHGLAELERLGAQPEVRLSESELNLVGYSFLRANHLESAIAFFEANARLHPESWNAHDSLGEAYLANGQRSQALAAYRTSVGLNPENLDGMVLIHELLR